MVHLKVAERIVDPKSSHLKKKIFFFGNYMRRWLLTKPCGNHFAEYACQVSMLYTLKLHSIVC